MTGYLYAAIVCRVLALLAVAATVWLAFTAPWWAAALTGWAAFLSVFLGGATPLAHRRTLAPQSTGTRHPKETHPA